MLITSGQMSPHFAQGFKLAGALFAPIVTTLFFRARALATARARRHDV